jgi:hypothetical protein
VHKLECLSGADFHACLFSIGASLLTPERSVRAQIAFGGFPFCRIPDGPMRPLRTSLDASLAADALFLVDSSDIAVRCINVTGACRTVLNAERRNALSA